MGTFNQKEPKEKRKVDTDENGDVVDKLEKFRKRDRQKIGVKIDDKTYILIRKEKFTKDYADDYRLRLIKSRESMNI
jgi:hypothetical protein